MHKGSLVDILFERAPEEQTAEALSQPPTPEKARSCRHHDFSARHPHQKGLKSSKIIKITQFNSSLVIGDDKMMHSSVVQANSSSPQKNFNIKKIADFKNKIMANAQKTVEIHLKKNEHELSHNFKPSSAKNGQPVKGSISKALVATKCNVYSEIPTLDNLLSSFHTGDEVFQRQFEEVKSFHLHSIYFNHFPKLESSKDLLAETNVSMREQSCKQERKSNTKIVNDHECFLEEIQSPIPKRTYSPRKMHSRHLIEQKKYQENLEKQKRQILQMKKQLNKNYSRPFNPPENITAQAYLIYETDLKKIQYNPKLQLKREDNEDSLEQKKMLLHSHKVLASFNPRAVSEIASLTKIMTCIVTLQIAKKLSINISQQFVTIGSFQQNIGGTSANIKKGEVYSIEQLLYGLMLPSGNDASLALAVWGGKKLLERQKSLKLSQTCNKIHFMKKQSYCRFITQMNNKASQLCMEKTKYANSHGLSNVENRSCAFDLGILCQYAMNNDKFRDIVSTKIYETHIQVDDDSAQLNVELLKPKENKIGLQKRGSFYDPSEGMMEQEEMKDAEDIAEEYEEEEVHEFAQATDLTKAVQWQNSHLLLQSKSDLYIGIKTGVTTTAGPCLASCIGFQGRKFIIIVLNCKSMKHRFKDTENLRRWLFNKEGFKYNEKDTNAQEAN